MLRVLYDDDLHDYCLGDRSCCFVVTPLKSSYSRRYYHSCGCSALVSVLELYWSFILHLPHSLRQKTRLDPFRSAYRRPDPPPLTVVKKHDICIFDAGTGSTAQRVAPHPARHQPSELLHTPGPHHPRLSAPLSIRPRNQLPRSTTRDIRGLTYPHYHYYRVHARSRHFPRPRV